MGIWHEVVSRFLDPSSPQFPSRESGCRCIKSPRDDHADEDMSRLLSVDSPLFSLNSQVGKAHIVAGIVHQFSQQISDEVVACCDASRG